MKGFLDEGSNFSFDNPKLEFLDSIQSFPHHSRNPFDSLSKKSLEKPQPSKENFLQSSLKVEEDT